METVEYGLASLTWPGLDLGHGSFLPTLLCISTTARLLDYPSSETWGWVVARARFWGRSYRTHELR
jgi:hypothetical protein